MLKFEIAKKELVSFLKKISLGDKVEDAIITVSEKSLSFKGINLGQSFYIDVIHNADIKLIDCSGGFFIVDDIQIFLKTLDNINTENLVIEFDGDAVKFPAAKKAVQLRSSTEENIKSNMISTIEFDRKKKTYKCSSGEFKFSDSIMLSADFLKELICDSNILQYKRFTFNVNKKENNIHIVIDNAGNKVEYNIETDLSSIKSGFNVVFGADFSDIITHLLKTYDDIILMFNSTDDTPMLICCDKMYFFIQNSNQEEEF